MPDSLGAAFNSFMQSIKGSTDLSDSEKSDLIKGVTKAARDEPPPTLVFVGQSGVGKSTTINALFNAGQKVGHIAATTRHPTGIDIYFDHVAGSHGDLLVYDMPGLGDSRKTYRPYLDLYIETIQKADAVLWVHPATDRAIEYMQSALLDLFKVLPREYRDRLVFGLNKSDEMDPANWNPLANRPSGEQLENLEGRLGQFTRDMSDLVERWRPQTVVYSAKQRYNLPKLFLSLMAAVPKKRRWVLESRMDVADFSELADQSMVDKARQVLEGISGRTTPQGSNTSPKLAPATFEEYLSSLPKEEYDRLVADRVRFMQVMREWERRS